MTTNSDGYISDWEGDVLERNKSAQYLTTYLNNLFKDLEKEGDDPTYQDTFVLALNAEWGYGKTFMLRRWYQDLKNNKHPVVFFNAWENDFNKDPLIAFISELEDELKEYGTHLKKAGRQINKVIDSAKSILPIAKILEAAQTGDSIASDFIESLSNKLVNDQKDRKEKISTFRTDLNNLIKKLKQVDEVKLPMYVFIDELDRCRPDYAIELLESIKHIFGTKGVYFIVAINKSQLCKSIKAVYGTEFDSITYLHRFFNCEYSIPKPKNIGFSKLLFKKYRLEADKTYEFHEYNKDVFYLGINQEDMFAKLADFINLPLRSQERTAQLVKTIYLSSSYEQYHFTYLIFLIMLKFKNEEIFESVINFSEKLSIHNKSETFLRLKKLLDTTITVRCWISSDNGRREGRKSLLEIIVLYQALTLSSATKVDYQETFYGMSTSNAINNTLRSESPNSYKKDEFYPLSIARYPLLIEQAGQLS